MNELKKYDGAKWKEVIMVEQGPIPDVVKQANEAIGRIVPTRWEMQDGQLKFIGLEADNVMGVFPVLTDAETAALMAKLTELGALAV